MPSYGICIYGNIKPLIHCLYIYTHVIHLGFGAAKGAGHKVVRKVRDHHPRRLQFVQNHGQSCLLKPGNPVPVGDGRDWCQVPPIQQQWNYLLHPRCAFRFESKGMHLCLLVIHCSINLINQSALQNNNLEGKIKQWQQNTFVNTLTWFMQTVWGYAWQPDTPTPQRH